jgi:hypothetical protein
VLPASRRLTCSLCFLACGDQTKSVTFSAVYWLPVLFSCTSTKHNEKKDKKSPLWSFIWRKIRVVSGTGSSTGTFGTSEQDTKQSFTVVVVQILKEIEQKIKKYNITYLIKLT